MSDDSIDRDDMLGVHEDAGLLTACLYGGPCRLIPNCPDELECIEMRDR